VALLWAAAARKGSRQPAAPDSPILCGRCGRYNPPASKFCAYCGRSLSGIAAIAMVIVMLLAAAPARAQETTPDWEIFGGYSFLHVNAGSGSVRLPDGTPIALQQNANGWEVSIGENANSWLGGIADFSGGYASRTLEGVTVHGSAYPFLFGPQFSFRKARSIVPFGRAMIGGVKARASVASTSLSASETKWTYAFGGGLDYQVSPHVAIRGQADFIRSHFPETLTKDFQNNIRVSAGVTFTLGHVHKWGGF